MARVAYPPPSHPDGNATIASTSFTVRFHHPAYYFRLGAVPFLELPAHERGGLHHETARLACALVAGNRVDGYLSTDCDGNNAVGADPDSFLTEHEYFFQVPAIRSDNWHMTEGSTRLQDEGEIASGS